jgi:competence protein ComEA
MKSARVSLLAVLLLAFPVLVSFAAAQENERKPEPLDLNIATVEQLQKLPGIGPATAKSIVRFREKSGPFRRVEDLLAVRGITKARLEKLRPHVTVKSKEPEGTLLPVGAG